MAITLNMGMFHDNLNLQIVHRFLCLHALQRVQLFQQVQVVQEIQTVLALHGHQAVLGYQNYLKVQWVRVVPIKEKYFKF